MERGRARVGFSVSRLGQSCELEGGRGRWGRGLSAPWVFRGLRWLLLVVTRHLPPGGKHHQRPRAAAQRGHLGHLPWARDHPAHGGGSCQLHVLEGKGAWPALPASRTLGKRYHWVPSEWLEAMPPGLVDEALPATLSLSHSVYFWAGGWGWLWQWASFYSRTRPVGPWWRLSWCRTRRLGPRAALLTLPVHL